jgi:hypothetical protein
MLSKHLEEAVDRFDIEPSSKAPISEIDAKIIDSLVDIFGLIYYKDLSKILDKWKDNPDEEILHKLQYWIETGPIASKTIIQLGDKEFNLDFFQSVSLMNSYDNNKRCPVFKIIVNKDDSEKLLFANTEIVFYSEEDRERALEDFKERTKYLKIKFI